MMLPSRLPPFIPPGTSITPPNGFALGGVPLERIIFWPLPGTATEADLLRFVECDKRLCELIDGTLVEKPVGYWEGIIATNLRCAVGSSCEKVDLALSAALTARCGCSPAACDCRTLDSSRRTGFRGRSRRFQPLRRILRLKC